MNTKFLIRVGSGADYQFRFGRNGYAVFRRTAGAVVAYIIAKDVKPGSEVTPIPTSVLREFATQEEAIAKLNAYADAREDTPLLKQPPPPTAFTRKNCNRPNHRKVGPGQREFSF